jgi:hypothetical protein
MRDADAYAAALSSFFGTPHDDFERVIRQRPL